MPFNPRVDICLHSFKFCLHERTVSRILGSKTTRKPQKGAWTVTSSERRWKRNSTLLCCLYRGAGSGECGGTGSWITTLCRYRCSGSACPATSMPPMSAVMANLSSSKVLELQHSHTEQRYDMLHQNLLGRFWEPFLCSSALLKGTAKDNFPAAANVDPFKNLLYKHKKWNTNPCFDFN